MKTETSTLKSLALLASAMMLTGHLLGQTAIPLVNSGFETNTDGTVFSAKVSSGFDVSGNDVAGWLNIGNGNNSCGVDYQGDNGITVHSGSVCAWTMGGQPGAYQITGYQIQAGDQLTLTWWAKSTYSPSGNTDQTVSLLSATNTTDVFTNLSVLATSSAPLNNTGNGGAYTQYTLNYVATSDMAGKYVAVSFKSVTGGNHYAAFDDFNLFVQPNQNLPILGNAVANPNPCYALSTITVTNTDNGTATGTTYRWQTNSDLTGAVAGTWSNIAGAISLAIYLTPADVNPAGADYTLDCRLIAVNGSGSVTSAPVALVVKAASSPILTTDITPSSANINAGTTTTFNAAFTGTVPITYQWQTDAGQPGTFTNIPLANFAAITLTNPLAGNYQLMASNVVGIAFSSAANVTVSPVFFANILGNSSFEFNTAGAVFSQKVFQGFDVPANDVAVWKNSGTNYGDSGVDFAGDNGLTVEDGHVAAYEHAGDDGAYQVTGYQLKAGDQLTLTWWAKSTYLSAGQQVELLSATNISDAYSNLIVLATSTDPLYYVGNSADYFQYTLTYTATSADEGRYIAVSFINNGLANSYTAFDAFSLNVLQQNPMISAQAINGQMQLNWLDGVLLEAPTVNGPWTTNIYATSPFQVKPEAPAKFYRTQLQ